MKDSIDKYRTYLDEAGCGIQTYHNCHYITYDRSVVNAKDFIMAAFAYDQASNFIKNYLFQRKLRLILKSSEMEYNPTTLPSDYVEAD